MIDTDPIPHADLWAQERERSETLWLLCDALAGAVARHLRKVSDPELELALKQTRSILAEDGHEA
jgi:hypothetical protein